MEILNQFGINPILLAAQVVNFLVLLFILKRFLYKPILKVLEQRKKRIEDSLKNAEEIEKRLLETEEERDKVLVKATQEAQKLVDQTKKDLEKMAEEVKQHAQMQAEQIIRKGEEAAKAESQRIQGEMMGKMAEIVAMGMEKVSGESFNTKQKKDMIERSIKNIS